MTQTEKDILFYLQVALGHANPKLVKGNDWNMAMLVAIKQGVIGLVLDGINKCFEQGMAVEMGFDTKMEWIGVVSQMEQQYQRHEKHLRELAAFYMTHGINMMVLKGYGLSKNYPEPFHRPCGDIDIYLFGKQKEGDRLLHEKLGVGIDKSHHHHTVFKFQGEMVENHYDFLNVHVRPSNKRIEAKLKELCHTESTETTDNIYYPSAEFNAIYLLRHCAAHFASTEMSVRQVLDWGLFMEKYHKEIKWDEYLPYLKEEGMYRFYNLLGLFCIKHLGFDEAIFHGLHKDKLFERFGNEIMEPEFKEHENGNLLHSLSVKPRRWWHNRWKNRLCYPDSAWSEFSYGLWAKVLKPSHFIQ